MADNATTPTNETAPADAAAREQAIRELTLAEVKKVKDGFTKDQWQNMSRERRSDIVKKAHVLATAEIAAREEAARRRGCKKGLPRRLTFRFQRASVGRSYNICHRKQCVVTVPCARLCACGPWHIS